MKIFTIMLFLLSATTLGKAQTFNEWFRQDKTQNNYLIQQITALEVYIELAQTGYSIAKGGLGTIGVFKADELSQHTSYFNSLRKVKPSLRKLAKVADIVNLQVVMVTNYKKTIQWIQQNNAFNGDEQAYIKRVFDRLLEDCEIVLDELIVVTTNGELDMKDDERLERIDVLYRDMMDKSIFSQSFSNETKTLAAFRAKENQDAQMGRLLHDINKD